ncbi:MAG: hypothetical protein NZ577_04075, partial [Vicinamibacterales bacterium]|nr:hypothetical protein [Vicinamibacterales bacterium]
MARARTRTLLSCCAAKADEKTAATLQTPMHVFKKTDSECDQTGKGVCCTGTGLSARRQSRRSKNLVMTMAGYRALLLPRATRSGFPGP